MGWPLVLSVNFWSRVRLRAEWAPRAGPADCPCIRAEDKRWPGFGFQGFGAASPRSSESPSHLAKVTFIAKPPGNIWLSFTLSLLCLFLFIPFALSLCLAHFSLMDSSVALSFVIVQVCYSYYYQYFNCSFHCILFINLFILGCLCWMTLFWKMLHN